MLLSTVISVYDKHPLMLLSTVISVYELHSGRNDNHQLAYFMPSSNVTGLRHTNREIPGLADWRPGLENISQWGPTFHPVEEKSVISSALFTHRTKANNNKLRAVSSAPDSSAPLSSVLSALYLSALSCQLCTCQITPVAKNVPRLDE